MIVSVSGNGFLSTNGSGKGKLPPRLNRLKITKSCFMESNSFHRLQKTAQNAPRSTISGWPYQIYPPARLNPAGIPQIRQRAYIRWSLGRRTDSQCSALLKVPQTTQRQGRCRAFAASSGSYRWSSCNREILIFSRVRYRSTNSRYRSS